MKRFSLTLIALLVLALACNFPAPTQPIDLLATLQAITPQARATKVPAPSTFGPADEPTGKIVLTCQINKSASSEQICVVNADGSGYRRITNEDDIRHYYASISPDGQSVVYSAYSKQSKHHEIYELNLTTSESKSIVRAVGDLNAPEISPDGQAIAFTRFITDPERPTTWLTDRDGGNLRQVSKVAAWDPTWSPDGKQILFASYANDASQLFVINVDGTGLRQVSDLPALRGRSDWSSQGLIVTYSGKPWLRELYVMNPNGSGQHQLSPSGGNSQGPSFSPDGKWVAFTSYFDDYEVNGCEIYILRVDGTDLRRLTDNDYCDYQPRWGP